MGWGLKGQDGMQSLELAALLPLLLIAALVVWQFALTGYTLVAAEAAVRDAARAAATGGDAVAAARLTAGDLLEQVDLPVYTWGLLGCQVSVRLQARVPLVPLPLWRGQTLLIARQAVMAAAAESCP